MSILIIGAGLSGLVCAVKIKMRDPKSEVIIIEKSIPQGNTQIAGLRFRDKDILLLLKKGNGGKETQPMRIFTKIALYELKLWQKLLPNEDRSEWFGPQFFHGSGEEILYQLNILAKQYGVKFFKGEVVKLIIREKKIRGVIIKTSERNNHIAKADFYILANGNIGGSLFLSTNMYIKNSAHELAFRAGIPLIDTTIHLFHPFGRCDEYGHIQHGCYETDRLADVKVYFADGIIDRETTYLLRHHDAHNHFDEITRRFVNHGLVVRLVFPDDSEQYARVSHHYSHISIETEDGVKVKGIYNLFAVGDASNLGYWTNHHIRFPGFALLKCFVDGVLVQKLICDFIQGSQQSSIKSIAINHIEQKQSIEIIKKIQEINTKYVFLYTFNRAERRKIVQDWFNTIKILKTKHKIATLGAISEKIAQDYILQTK